jgi:glutathione synthase/RimK-type ligase-like ATP-grasp enzyme
LWEAELKLVQLRRAQAFGLPIPPTLVTNDPVEAHEFVKRFHPVVAKPVRYGLLGATPQPLVAWTSRVDATSLGELQGPPVILQKEVAATAHLRVVTIGSQTFVARLATDSLDWREDAENHDRFQAVPDDELGGLRKHAALLARELRLGFSAQDWIETREGVVFLEANPSGQWLFLDPAFHGRLLDAMVRELESLAGLRHE